jgi:hypothetical protein
MAEGGLATVRVTVPSPRLSLFPRSRGRGGVTSPLDRLEAELRIGIARWGVTRVEEVGGGILA